MIRNIFDKSVINALIKIDPYNTAFIYVAEIDKYKDLTPDLLHYLSMIEKTRAEKYYTQLLKDKYVISHGLLRLILSIYTLQLPQSLKFIQNKYNKPFLPESKIQFNMSHSHKKVCYIVAHTRKIGIDIEFIDNNRDTDKIIKSVLTPKEIISLNNLQQHQRKAAFYDLWTKKESLIKAVGLGLFYPVNAIDLSLHNYGNKIILNYNIYEELYCYNLLISPNYSGSMAINSEINRIIYIEANNSLGIFDQIREG